MAGWIDDVDVPRTRDEQHWDAVAALDDSDELGDPQDDGARDPNGYCPHGVYVGGCGIDWMCPACEFGDD